VAVRFPAVVVDRVTRIYGATRALSGVSVTFRGAQVTTVEGGNGAGKSTLLAVLSTLARPTSGTVCYGDLTLPEDRDEVRPLVGLVAHASMVPPELTAREALTITAKLQDLPEVSTVVDRTLASMGLEELAERPARTYSRGQLQRLALARALLPDPALLLFDEPTTGLDAASVARVEGAIARARGDGCVVVVVTHDLAFAERVGDVRVQLTRGRVSSVREKGASG
jgi:heme exporter protein A